MQALLLKQVRPWQVQVSLLACTRHSSSFLQGLAGNYTADRVLQRCMLLFLIEARLSFPTFVCLRIQHLQSKKAGKDGSVGLQDAPQCFSRTV